MFYPKYKYKSAFHPFQNASDTLGRVGERPFLKPLGDRFAFKAFHNEVIDSVLMANIVHHANVRMIEVGDGLGFSFKTLLANRIIRKLLRKDFDRNGAIQTNITGAVDFTHPASAEGRTNFIWTEKSP
jgi:hypothetical protein